LQRSKKILIASHCLLNQNTVIPEEARAMGAIPSVVEWAMAEGNGFLQLPCPEFTYLGLDRPPMTYEEYNTAEYREHCRRILRPFIDQLVNYQQSGFEIAGTVGIGRSPSCDPGRGVFMEEFQKMLAAEKIEVKTWWFLPPVNDPIFDPKEHRIK
jgi:predicted secreted protein